jgi:hypothetical protein
MKPALDDNKKKKRLPETIESGVPQTLVDILIP